MYKSKKIVALITARSKSKGLKNKNLKKIKKLSLIEHITISAKKSKLIDDIFISSDSKKYINIAKKRGAKSLFKRPRFLSGDNVNSMKVINHFLKKLKLIDKKYDYLILLEPTSPMTSSKDIDLALKSLINDKKMDSIVGISKILKFDLRSIFTLNKKLKLNNIQKKIFNNFNRFKNENLYFLDGSLYISIIDKLIANGGFISKKTKGFEFPYHKSFEIDNYLDFKIVKNIFKK